MCITGVPHSFNFPYNTLEYISIGRKHIIKVHFIIAIMVVGCFVPYTIVQTVIFIVGLFAYRANGVHAVSEIDATFEHLVSGDDTCFGFLFGQVIEFCYWLS